MSEATIFITVGITANFDENSLATIRKVADRENVSLPDAFSQIMGRHPLVIQSACERAIVAEARDLDASGDPPFDDAGSIWLAGGTYA